MHEYRYSIEKRLKAKLKKMHKKNKKLYDAVMKSVEVIIKNPYHYKPLRGEDYVVEWYKRMDDKIGELIFDTGFLDEEEDNKLIVISDHGFCSFGESKVQTQKYTKEGKIKGDHHEKALLITVGVDYDINRPQDVFYAIKEDFY